MNFNTVVFSLSMDLLHSSQNPFCFRFYVAASEGLETRTVRLSSCT